MAKGGHEVVVYEKMLLLVEEDKKSFTFDMGPSWYGCQMFSIDSLADFGKKTTDYYELSSYLLLIEYTLVSMNLLQSQII
jgi:phytoene desaturase